MPAHEPTPGSPADLQSEADPEQVARTIVLRRLNAAPRTRAQLEEDLAKRGVPADVSARVLTRFCEVGLVDDAAYARSWVDSRHRSRGSARSSLRRELRAKGVDEELVTEALAEITDEQERERAAALVRSRLRSTERLEPPARQRRLVALLARRGYPPGVAAAVVREVLGGEADALDSA